MATSIVHEDRIRRLDDGDRQPAGRGGHVTYWMQRSQRAEHNDALEHAVRLANEHGVPLHVVFGLTTDYPDASGRHFRFMLEGLRETAGALGRRSIPFAVRTGHPVDVAEDAADGAVLVVTDRAYQRHLVEWRQDLVDRLDLPVWEVEGDVVVPVDAVSDKREYAARTIRRKVNDRRDEHLQALTTTSLDHGGEPLPGGLDLDADVEDLLAELGFDEADGRGNRLTGGTSQARAHLDSFLDGPVDGYGERAPDPADPALSYQSAYLHYGQVSPVAAALRVRDSGAGSEDDREDWLEELIVRRELAVNYVRFEPDYDSYSALPEWARETLDDHRDDEREHTYSLDQLRHGRTHDKAWNACQAQVRETGYLHNHLRMFWGKQVMLWSERPETAFRRLLTLNNESFLDGRDCASFANVAWCFGLHDRAWQENDVIGKTRPMTRSGLESKLGATRFRAWIEQVEQRHGELAGD